MKLPNLIIAITLLVSSIAIVSFSGTASAETFYVGGAGGGNYTYIQGAINDASSGDIVYVYPGMYTESIFIDKNIILRGGGQNDTRLVPLDDGFILEACTDVTIENMAIENAVTPHNMYIWNCSSVKLQNMNVEGGINSHAISILNSDDITVNNLFINGSDVGIFANATSNVLIEKTIFNSGRETILASETSYLAISNSTFIGSNSGLIITQSNEIKIIDITGKLIKTIKQNTNVLNVADLSNGIYFIKFITDERTITQKFVKR